MTEERVICDGCGEEFKLSETTEVDALNLCDDCLEKDYEECYSCGLLKKKDEITRLSIMGESQSICNDCIDDYRSCDCCGEYVNVDDLHSVEGGDGRVCQQCYNNDYVECHDCGYVGLYDNMRRCEYCEEYFCESCGCSCADDEEEENNGLIFSNRNVCLDKKHGKITSKSLITVNRLVGCEIECESSGNCPESINDIVSSYIGIAHDGSLENGVEIITPPASLNALENILKNTTRALRENGLVVSKRCGLHIHMDMSDLKGKYGKVSNILKTYLLVEPILFSMLPASRIISRFCTPLSKFYRLEHFSPKNFDELEKNWYAYSATFQERRGDLANMSYNEFVNENPNDGSSRWRGLTQAQKDKIEYQFFKKNWKKLTNLWKGDKYTPARYIGVNFHSYFFRGTLELRHHNGTLNASKIIRWININLSIVDYAIKRFNIKDFEFLKDGTLTKLKIKKFCHLLNLDDGMYKYILKRVLKFRGKSFSELNVDLEDDNN